MNTPFDQCLKDLIVDGAEQLQLGQASTEHEVHTHNQYIDLFFSPAARPVTAFAPLGVLGRIISEPAAIEGFHCTPTPDDMASCQRKHQNFCYELAQRGTAIPVPRLWLMSSGRPVTGIEGYGYQAAPDWPTGIYMAAPLFRFALVVASELPVTRETVLLRLMGAGATLRQALDELTVMPQDAFERRLALPVVTRLRIKIQSKPEPPSTEEQEFLMSTQQWYETWKAEQRREGRKEGRKEGRQEGRKEGRQEGRKEGLIAMYQARFGAMPEDLRVIIQATDDEERLLGWYELVTAPSAEAFSDAIKAEAAKAHGSSNGTR